LNGSRNDANASPLSVADVNQLDSTLLPALERHHLRLLAHALRTLQHVQQAANQPGLPDQATIESWLRQQPSLSGDNAFIAQLAHQLTKAAQQLEALAQQRDRNVLTLQLDDLIAWAQTQADQRLRNEPPRPHPQAPAGPPTAP